ncbi:T9SS type A sorting domain-containing protein [Candidatus Poribacteria bacterium]|nr:T9SS type A sorting domain-containing protein [Candidatus Poribacteria bacterium]
MKRKTNPSFLSSLPSFHSSILLTSTLLAIVLWLFSFTTLLHAVPQLSIVEAKIDRPHTGELLGGKVGIFGIARGTMFKEYRLEYTPVSTDRGGTVSTGWRQIGGGATAPVTETGFLGQWDAQRLRGEFLIRLVVISTQGDKVQDQIHVFIENERPRLKVSNPSQDLLTLEKQITVRGTTEKSNTVTLKSEQMEISLPVDSEGGFVTQLPLSEGLNRIEIQVTNPIGLETSVIRTIVRDNQPPEITLTSPPDFALLEVPYATVSGQVNDPDARLLINGTAVPLKAEGHFERTLRLKKTDSTKGVGDEIANLINVVAIDRLGRKTEVQRRISYKAKDPLLGIDLSPPAITEVLPLDGTLLDRSDVKITGFLIDNVEIDPLTIRFSFGEETFVFDGRPGAAQFDGSPFDFQPETGKFTYTPLTELIDGTYHFKLQVQDTAGNSAAPIDFTFTIDTRPFQASISAERVEGTRHILRITLTTTRRLGVTPALEILPSGATLGYTPNLDHFSVADEGLNADLKVGNHRLIFRYALDFPTSASQTGFTFSAEVRSLNGEVLPVRGYFTDQNQLFEDIQFPRFIQSEDSSLAEVFLSIDSGPSVRLLNGDAAPQVILRSQGGLDQNMIRVQQQNADTRELTILDPIYVVESSVEMAGVSFQLALPLPLEPNKSGNGVAMFQWDSQFQQWLPLDTVRNQLGMFEAIVDRFGSYALLVDRTPPIINTIFPQDSAEVQPDRFLIVHEITDEGSGVGVIQLWVDNRAVQFLYEDTTGHLTYLPSNLRAGRHTLEVSATDRAGNEARQTMDFFTQDIFDFADKVIVYPNPTSHDAIITFQLTKSADVTLEIYDVTGGLLYTDVLRNVVGQQSASVDEAFVWDCKNQAGESVTGGVYIYILEAKWEGETVRRLGKVAVVR